MFFITQKQQLVFCFALLLSALVIGYIAYDPAARAAQAAAAVSAVRLPRPQQVMFMEADAPLEVGDAVFVPAVFAPSVARIAALPRESIILRNAGSAAASLLILGRDSYYVTIPNGVGHIVSRADLRQLVSN
ncbi:MAG TPA: hypothetical protein VGF13_01890 [Verrucomicrobiae bacterium]